MYLKVQILIKEKQDFQLFLLFKMIKAIKKIIYHYLQIQIIVKNIFIIFVMDLLILVNLKTNRILIYNIIVVHVMIRNKVIHINLNLIYCTDKLY